MVDNPEVGGTPTPEGNPSEGAASSEPNESDDFTPEQKKRIGQLLSKERKTVREQFKDYDDLKKKISEIENSKLSEAEKLQKERDEARGEAANIKKQLEELSAKEMRINMFADFKTKDGQNLPINLIKYVQGNSKDDILESIESIAADFGAKLEKKKGIGNPTPPGGSPAPSKHAFMNEQILVAAGRGGR